MAISTNPSGVLSPLSEPLGRIRYADEVDGASQTTDIRDMPLVGEPWSICRVSWTPDRKDTLRRMWVEGKTSRQIAEALGDVTRNAVMGMVNRMGLMGNKAHNSLIRSAHGACRPIGVDAAGVLDDTPQVVVPEPLPQEVPQRTAEPPVINDDTAPEPVEKRSRLASRLLGPLRRTISPGKAPTEATAYVTPDEARAEPPTKRLDWRTAISMVEEVVGDRYKASSVGHRTSLVAISSILGGGDPRRFLPRGFPEPFVISTMRSLAEKGIMVAGSTPEAWLDPEIGDLNFFIDMLVVEGVLKGPRTSSTPMALTA